MSGRGTASWVIRVKETGQVICETFSASTIAAINTAKYEAVPILQYLGELNASIKALDNSLYVCKNQTETKTKEEHGL